METPVPEPRSTEGEVRMDDWVRTHVHLAVILEFVLLGVIIVLFVLWAVTARSRRWQRLTRLDAERDRLDSELLLREELGRLRIVRELNELAVHSVSVIISQADGAQFAGKADPDAAVRASALIADTARATLADLRRVLTVTQDGEAAAAQKPRRDTARDLFRSMEAAGLQVEFVETGDRFELSGAAELAVFRIIQESLNNALAHGGKGTSAKVSLTWTTDGLQLLIDDDGARTRARRKGLDPDEAAQQRPYTIDDDLNALTEVFAGAGITEMRERAAIFGGILNAYAVPGVGFSISAIFPALRYNNGVHGVNLTERATRESAE